MLFVELYRTKEAKQQSEFLQRIQEHARSVLGFGSMITVPIWYR